MGPKTAKAARTASSANLSDTGGMRMNMLPPGVVRYRGREYTVGPATPAISAFKAMRSLQVDIMPVVEDGMVRGAVQLPVRYSPKNTDMARYFYDLRCGDVSRENFGSDYPRASPGFTVDDALALMHEHRLSYLPLVGKSDAHAGMIGMYGPMGLLNLDGIFEQLEKNLNEPKMPYLCTRG